MNGGTKAIYIATNQPKGKNPENAFEQSFDNVKYICDQIKHQIGRARVSASYVVFKQNENDVLQATVRAKRAGVRGIFFRPDQRLTDKRSQEALDSLSRISNLLSSCKQEETDTFFVDIEYQRELDNIIVEDAQSAAGCPYSNHSAYIASNGDLYPCCYTRIDKKYVYGNAFEAKFEQAWLTEGLAQNWTTIRTAECPSCPHISANAKLLDVYNNKLEFQQSTRDVTDYFV